MKPQKPGNSPGPGPEVVKRQRVAKERAARRVRTWTVQTEMRDIPGTNDRRRCMKNVFIVAKMRENTASVTREHKFPLETEGTCRPKNLDETVRLQSEKSGYER